jgi:hypothetical protein
MAMSDERDPSLSSLYCLGATEEPPATLDARILAAARRELVAVPVRQRPAWFGWLAPMGVAATVVLSISLIVVAERDQPDLLPAAAPVVAPPIPELRAPPAQAERSAALPTPEPALAKKRDVSPVLPLAKPTAPESGEGRMREEVAPAAEQGLRAIAPPAPAAKLELQRADSALRSPEIWLEDIRRLKNQGQLDALREQLAAFRRAYPDYPLPVDLQGP